MSTKDITTEQMETLVLIRSVEEFISTESNDFDTLADALWTLNENFSVEDSIMLATNIKSLTKNGYLISEGTENDGTEYDIPEVKSITSKGIQALDIWVEEVKNGQINKPLKSYKIFKLINTIITSCKVERLKFNKSNDENLKPNENTGGVDLITIISKIINLVLLIGKACGIVGQLI